MGWESIPARVPHPTCIFRQSLFDEERKGTYLVESEESIELHHSKVISKQYPRRYIDDISRTFPEVRSQFRRSRNREPEEPAEEDVPGWEVVASVLCVLC